jgi:hypothetical protein
MRSKSLVIITVGTYVRRSSSEEEREVRAFVQMVFLIWVDKRLLLVGMARV